jgi:hypothetical protein
MEQDPEYIMVWGIHTQRKSRPSTGKIFSHSRVSKLKYTAQAPYPSILHSRKRQKNAFPFHPQTPHAHRHQTNKPLKIQTHPQESPETRLVAET